MTTVAPEPTTNIDELVEEFRAWLEQNWDPDITVGEWWERLGTSGWGAPTLPTNAYGKGLSRPDAMRISAELGKVGALGPPAGLGLLLAAPTIATHGTQEQIDLYVREIVTGKKGWCQLFSEPGAGSDLAGLSTKAVEVDGGEFVINGQKVWTSGGNMADMGMLLARTDPTVPKHQGITWFAFNMLQPGVDVRPLREMTGHAMFSEVFFSDARVSKDAIINGINNGWAGGEHDARVRARGPRRRRRWRRGRLRGSRHEDGTPRQARRRLRPEERRRAAEARPQRRTPADERRRAVRRSREGQREVEQPRRPSEAREPAHPRRDRTAQRRAPQGDARDGRRHPGHGEHLEAADERDRPSVTRHRSADRSAPRGCSPRRRPRSRR